jgi:muramoyltetrapeptide carboxypeptidase LdcA involved in peptidoglycan recycling
MNRSNFIKQSLLGVGVALLPSALKAGSSNTTARNNKGIGKIGGSVFSPSVPSFLAKGDKVGLIASSSSTQLHALLSKSGLKASYNVANELKNAASLTNNLLKDKSVKAIFIDMNEQELMAFSILVDWSALRTTKKWVIGVKDNTVLNTLLNSRYNLATAVGSNLQEQLNVAMGKVASLKMDAINSRDNISLFAPVVGGSVSSIEKALVSKNTLHSMGKVIMLQNDKESSLELEDTLWKLKRNGTFNKTEGVILLGKNPKGSKLSIIARKVFSSDNYPVAVSKAETLPTFAIGAAYNVSLNNNSIQLSNPA